MNVYILHFIKKDIKDHPSLIRNLYICIDINMSLKTLNDNYS